jgi:hypothetical protein
MSAAIGHRGAGVGPVPPLETLGLAPGALCAEIERVTVGFHLKLEWQADIALFVARVESGCPPLLLIDTDLVGCPGDLCRFARSLRPDVRIFGISCYWSERDEALLTCVDALLHKPPRRAQWEAVFDRAGIPRALQPPPLRLAS